MSSQPCHNVGVTQAVHGVDGITTLNFMSQVNSLDDLHPQIDTLIY